MNLEKVSRIVVVGSGTMGLGIAQLSAQAGFETLLFDIDGKALKKAVTQIGKNLDGAVKRGKCAAKDKKAILDRISTSTELDDCTGDIIIEAIIERLDIKIELFQKLSEINGAKTILASNTSSIPITSIAATLPRPERFAGMHFFNPAHIMKLVEIISGAATKSSVAKTLFELAEKMGKTPVMAADSPGFIVNRVARHFYVESLKVLEEQVCDHEEIDQLIEASGFKMGPFRLMDLIGVETNYSVTESMFNSFSQDAKFRPSRIQKQKVDAGHHGRKTGKGFYNY